eukprot:gnl/Chilomastix_caulleri/923.p1 GENE.gnl/Chilomastix_caulleri/923~~gnl/Chilomastix_caulleri/923.p1  ORF type:complete len:255 (-),score=97.65 gnl/Chilomastix_caulleri/923:17-781(-)
MYRSSGTHDRGVNTFSREGRIYQIEYATKAVNLSSTVIAIKHLTGVILVTEKKPLSPLMISGQSEKLIEIDSHVVCGIAGLIADAHTLVDYARNEAQNHVFAFGEQVPVRALAEAICDVMISFGEYNTKKKNAPRMARPFGVALLLAGVDKEGISLYSIDPAGTYAGCSAKALGAGSETAQDRLCAEWPGKSDGGLAAAFRCAIKTLKGVTEGDLQASSVAAVAISMGEDGIGSMKTVEEEEIKVVFDQIEAAE